MLHDLPWLRPGGETLQDNPFTYGNPISDPQRFFGRTREIEQIFGRLRNPEFESSSVVGDRRIGKTSMLNYLADPGVRAAHGLGAGNYTFVYADLQMVDDAMGPEQLWRRLLASLQAQCRDDVIVTALKEVLARRQLDTFDLDGFFQKVDDRGHHVAFLLDEFARVTTNANFRPDFYFGFRSLAIHHNVALVTSSRLELVELCHSEDVRSSPFFNIFANINLRMFSFADFRTLVSESLSSTGVRFTDQEITEILDLAGLHPYFLQVACWLLFEAHSQGLDPASRQAFLVARFQDEANPHFIDYWGKSGDPEKIVLTAAALLERQAGRSAGVTAGDLRRVFSRAEPNIVRLDKRSLLMRTDADWRLFSCVLGPWILDQIMAELGEQQSFPQWLAQNKEARERVRGRRGKSLKEVLPKIGPQYRQLILTWASDPQSVVAMAGLLKSVLSMVS
jgi:hypothetical protein